MDQLVSSIPGFIAQEQTNIRYKLTRRRFKAATVFVDHYSRLSYVHVHTSTGGEEAVQAKEAFEAYAAQRGVYVKHYHGDNGIFKSDKWIQHCQRQKQTYTFCGADSHHQNGIAEHRIRTLTDSARTQLIHACKHNPGVYLCIWRHLCSTTSPGTSL